MYTFPSATINHVTYTALRWGQFPTITYTTGGTHLAELVTVASDLSNITIKIASGVSTNADIKAAILAADATVQGLYARDLISVVIAGGHTTDTNTAVSATTLSGAVNGGLAYIPPTYPLSELATDPSGVPAALSPTSTELSYLSGVTSSIQTQLAAVEAGTFALTNGDIAVGNASNVAVGVAMSGDVHITNAGATTIQASAIVDSKVSATAAIALSKLAAVTASKALVSDSSGVVVASAVTATELGYVAGATSAIQTQINTVSTSDAAKLPLAGGTMTGAFIPWSRTTTQRDALFVAASGTITIVDYTQLAGKTVTINGEVLTEGSDWTAATSNPATATSLASAITTNTATTLCTGTANSAVVTATANTAGTAGNSLTLATNAISAAATVSGATLSGGIQPVAGTVVYNSTTGKLNVFTTAWQAVTSA